MKRKVSILLFGLFSLYPCAALQIPSLADTIALSEEVITGKLANGFTYFIQRSNESKEEAVMYFVVKAGSLHEDTGQVEVAHLLEHIAFKGSKYFADAWSFLESLGVKRGLDANAHTGPAETFYWFRVPSKNPEVLRDGIQLLRDFAQNLSLDSSTVEAERGVVLAEAIRSSGYFQRMRDKYYSKFIGDSLCGKKFKDFQTRNVGVRGFKVSALRAFYNKWYTADREAVIIVGNIDPKGIEAEIQRLFSDLRPSSGIEEEYRDCEAIRSRENQFMIVTDPEMPTTEVRMFMKKPLRSVITYGDLKASVVEDLYNEMARQRFRDLGAGYNLPFRIMQNNISNIALIDWSVLQTYVEIKPGMLREGVKAAMEEVERIKRWGFTLDEMEKARISLLNALDIPEATSSTIAVRYHNYFVNGRAAPDIQHEFDLRKEMLSKVSAKDVLGQLNEYFVDGHCDVLILAPDNNKESLPDQKTVIKWLDEVKAMEILPKKARQEITLKPVIKPLRPVDTGRLKKRDIGNGAIEVVSGNGALVIFKPIKSSKGAAEVRLHVFRNKGASQYRGNDYFSAAFSADVISNSGVGNLDKFQLREFLSKKAVSVSPYVYERQSGIRASSSLANFETMMQVVYCYFVSPVKDKDAFLDWMSSYKDILGQEQADPSFIFQKSIDDVLGNVDRTKSLVPAQLDDVIFNKVHRIYQELFGNASEFTFILVGDFEVDDVMPNVMQYVANLPGQEAMTAQRSEPLTNKPLAIRESIRKPIYVGLDSSKAVVQMHFVNRLGCDLETRAYLDVFAGVLRQLLFERLRERENGVYDVVVGKNYKMIDAAFCEYDLQVDFDCESSSSQKMIYSVLEELATLKKEGPSDSLVKRVVENEIRSIQINSKSSDFWLEYLFRQCRDGHDFNEINRYVSLFEAITPENLRRFAASFLSNDQVIEFLLLPRRQ